MSARAIVSGVLFRAPAEKTTKTGRRFIFATIRESGGDVTRWWKTFIFNEGAIEEILRIGDGEPIAVAGEFDCELYAPAGGQSRLSWKITADTVLTAKAKPKSLKKEASPAKIAPSKAGAPALWDRGGPNDPIPF